MKQNRRRLKETSTLDSAMAVPYSTTAQEKGDLVSNDDHHGIELAAAGVASGDRAEHAIEIRDPPPTAAVEPDAGLVATVESMKQRLQEMSASRARREAPTIFRVPRKIRDVRPSAYEPKIISFGPYHRGREHLRRMEEQKWRYLRCLLARENGSRSLEDYMRKMKELEGRARSCYADATDELDCNQFAEMMTLDGCFIVEFLLRLESGQGEQAAAGGAEEDEDVVFNSTWGYSLLMDDMLLLENQLPFFVLQQIWSVLFGPGGCANRLVWGFLSLFRYQSPTNSIDPSLLDKESLDSLLIPPHHHLLHLFHSYILPVSRQDDKTAAPADAEASEHPFNRELITSATQLKEAGVKFRRWNSSRVLKAEFSSSTGEMRISPLSVFDNTEAYLRNLIAFEQCVPEAGNLVTTYAVLLDRLVDTAADVALLKRRRVLINGLSSDKEAAGVINELCKDGAYSYGTEKLWDDVNVYSNKKWPQRRAELVHRYFSNPWTAVSLVAASMLLLLAFVQTFFAVLSYWKPPRPGD